jgi:ribose transport system substrate-binding protein
VKATVAMVVHDQTSKSGTDRRDGFIAGITLGMGAATFDVAMKTIKGESQPKTIDTGFYWYDKTNITDPKIAAVLND